jgi:ankyrin repeat protein
VEHRDKLSLALIAAGAAVDLVDQDGRTALIEATADHEDEVAQSLISQGANLNAQDRSGRSALIVVGRVCCADVICQDILLVI